MLSPNSVARSAMPAFLAALLVVSGCTIYTNKSQEGANHVDIKTPIGDLRVNDQPDMSEVGLAIYPGAKAAAKDSDSDKKSANVNLSVPGFSMKVVAGEFQSDDSNDKVLAFYNKELQRYGKIVECHGPWKGGEVHADTDKKDGLSKPVSCKDSNGAGDSVELKVGTEGNQHIVAVKPDGKGTRFALVYLRMHTANDSTI